MKAFTFGFDKPQTVEKRSIVLNSPAAGISNGLPCTANYRFVLMPDGDSYGNDPLFIVEQQYKTGEWGPTGGRWLLDNVWDSESDTISLQGQHWAVSGMILATIEAANIMQSIWF